MRCSIRPADSDRARGFHRIQQEPSHKRESSPGFKLALPSSIGCTMAKGTLPTYEVRMRTAARRSVWCCTCMLHAAHGQAGRWLPRTVTRGRILGAVLCAGRRDHTDLRSRCAVHRAVVDRRDGARVGGKVNAQIKRLRPMPHMASHGPSGWSWAKADLHRHTRLKVDGSRVHVAVASVNGPPYVLIHCVTCQPR